MLTPTARLLELLELLQAQPLITGREIADHLGIDRRTARRYVAALQDLGIPIEGQRGVGGGYRIRPGFRLPPLMLTDDEAVVVALGTLAAGRLGLSGPPSPSTVRSRRSTAYSRTACGAGSRRWRRRSTSRRAREAPRPSAATSYCCLRTPPADAVGCA